MTQSDIENIAHSILSSLVNREKVAQSTAHNIIFLTNLIIFPTVHWIEV